MQFQGKHLSVSSLGDGLHELCFHATGSVNKFDAATLQELDDVTALLSHANEVRGLLVTSALDAFIVGADIFEFVALFKQPVDTIRAFIDQQSQRFYRFSQLPFPTVACVNGLALGGGFEMALSCDERVLASVAAVGLPETTLGIIPGFGGCIRLSRLTGPITAMQWIVDAKPRKAAQALADGACEEVVDLAQLRASGLMRLEALSSNGAMHAIRAKRDRLAPIEASALQGLHAAVHAKAHLEPAPSVAVGVIVDSVGLSETEALQVEAAAFAQVAKTQAADALVKVFVNDQAVRKKAKQLAKGAHEVKRIGVIGAGIMGTGIAETCAGVGLEVFVYDTLPVALERSERTIRKNLQRQVEAKRLSPDAMASSAARIHYEHQLSALADCQWIIEAVSEKAGVKHEVFAALKRVATPDTLLASNTSSLSITELSQACHLPDRLLGLHFFNPVPKMPLVEIIPGANTRPEWIAQAMALALTLKKVPIVVGECAGFLVNRILMAYVAGFEAALAAGIPVAQIDRVMTQFGWPMGPAMLMDVIGLDTMVAIGEIIGRGVHESLRLQPSSVMVQLVNAGHLGQKTGVGFYTHERDEHGRFHSRLNPDVGPPSPATPESDQRVIDRLMCPMVFEAKRCLDEGIGHSVAEIDMAMILGLGFPKAVGGPLCWWAWRGEEAWRQAAAAISSTDALYRFPAAAA